MRRPDFSGPPGRKYRYRVCMSPRPAIWRASALPCSAHSLTRVEYSVSNFSIFFQLVFCGKRSTRVGNRWLDCNVPALHTVRVLGHQDSHAKNLESCQHFDCPNIGRSCQNVWCTSRRAFSDPIGIGDLCIQSRPVCLARAT